MLRLLRLLHTIPSSSSRVCTKVSSRAMSTHYSAIVIGSGQGGGPLAQAFAGAGQRTALIEAAHVGGTCINVGCTPTKTMVASARAAYVVSTAKKYGVGTQQSSVQVNMETVRKRKRDIVDSFRGGSEARFKATENLDLLMGTAKFTSAQEIQVVMNEGEGKEVKELTADKIFINSGCRPAPLQTDGADLIHALDSTSIMELDSVPSHLVVIGGGYIGIEFAQMFRRFGSQVSIIQRGPRLLPREDDDVSEAVKKILDEDGIETYLNAKAKSFSTSDSGSFVLSIQTESGDTKSIQGSHCLNATGRLPNTAVLDVAAAGIAVDQRGFVKVNEYLETNVANIYALGDVKGGPAFTHISYDDSRILKHNLLTNTSSSPHSIADRLVPYCVFMDPQLGSVGLSLTEARKKFPGRNVKVAKMPMAWVARALEMDESRGLMKGVVDVDTKEILGFTCLGIDGGELMSMVQIAMVGKLKYDALQDMVFAHPCLSECLNNLWGNIE